MFQALGNGSVAWPNGPKAPGTWHQQEFATNQVCWHLAHGTTHLVPARIRNKSGVLDFKRCCDGTPPARIWNKSGSWTSNAWHPRAGRGFGGGLFLLAARLALAATLALAAVATVHRPPLILLRRRALALAAVAPVHRPPLLLLRRTVAPVLRPPLLLLRRRTRALAGLLGKLLLPPSTSTISTSTSTGIRTSTS